MKKYFKILLMMSMVLALFITGCTNDNDTTNTTDTKQNKSEDVNEATDKDTDKDTKKISILIPGNEKDNGFMEAAYRGYEKVKNELDVEVEYVSNVSATSDEKVLTEELRKLAEKSPDLIVAQGGQNNVPAETVSKEFPEIEFVVIQGNVKGENLSSYVVDQEQSAWLAGALAGYMTDSNKVAHLSGAWPQPGLKARAAFYDGLQYVNPEAKFYSWFTGNLDDEEINKKAAEAQIKADVDIIYTMLNGGREGVNEAIKSTDGKIKEIGNVIDWTKESDIFIGSAVADSSVAIFNAAKDFVDQDFKSNQITTIGIEEPEVVALTMSEEIPEDIKTKINELSEKIKTKEIEIKTEYDGQEFNPETGEFVDQSFKETMNE